MLTLQQWIKATDAVKEFLITPTLSPQEMVYAYASETDILNMACQIHKISGNLQKYLSK